MTFIFTPSWLCHGCPQNCFTHYVQCKHPSLCLGPPILLVLKDSLHTCSSSFEMSSPGPFCQSLPIFSSIGIQLSFYDSSLKPWFSIKVLNYLCSSEDSTWVNPAGGLRFFYIRAALSTGNISGLASLQIHCLKCCLAIPLCLLCLLSALSHLTQRMLQTFFALPNHLLHHSSWLSVKANNCITYDRQRKALHPILTCTPMD